MALVITFTKQLRKEKFRCHIILLSPNNHALRLISLRWIKSILYYKLDKKSIVNDLYQVAVISVFAVGYSMLGKKILRMAPPSIQNIGKIHYHKENKTNVGKQIEFSAESNKFEKKSKVGINEMFSNC